ncbi:MAG: hypothetical protein ACN4GW_04105 [Desulforhopalus sp.]
MASEPNKKREMIIVVLAIIGLIYGAVDFGLRSLKSKNPSTSSGDGALEATTFSLITDELGAHSTTILEARALEVLGSLSARWPEDIFVDIESFVDDQEEEEALALVDESLIYSGYINMAEKLFAVINGIEYQIGDIVEGFILKMIDPMEIILEKNGRPARIPFKRLD